MAFWSNYDECHDSENPTKSSVEMNICVLFHNTKTGAFCSEFWIVKQLEKMRPERNH